MKYSKELHDTLVKSNYYDSHIINALLDEIDRLNAERRWIPVSERLPEPNDYVLVSSTGVDKGVYKMSLSGRAEGWQNNMGWYYAFDSVTHWMPLPEPPNADDYVGDSDHEHDDRIL